MRQTLCDRRVERSGDTTDRWRKLIRVGNFIHPKTKQRITVTPERLRHWADSGNQMTANGVRIPINADHNLSAFASLGKMLRFEVRGDGLWGEQEAADEKCADVIRRNDVSVGFDNFTDGTGTVWPDAIYHVSATQFPVITDLAKATAASHFPTGIYLSAEPGEQETPTVETLIDNEPTKAAMRMMQQP